MAFLRVVATLLFLSAIEASAQRPTLDEYKDGKAAEQAASDAEVARQKKMAAVDKAVTMLETLQAQILAEGEKEAASYNKFACFCKDTTAEKSAAIKKGQDDQAAITAEINVLADKRDTLDDTISKCQTDIKDAEKEMKEAEEQRSATLKTYEANSADMKAAIFALEGAIKTLKSSKTPSLLQVQGVAETVKTAALLADALGLGSKAQQTKLAAFVQQPDNSVEMEDYKFHSGDIIETLEGLLKDFIDEKNTVDADEVTSVKEHDLLMEEKLNFVKQTTKKMKDAKTSREETISEIQSNSKELSTVEATLLDDQEYLTKLSKMCGDKAKTWDQRSKVRSEELSTLTEAIGIVKGSVAEKTSAATLRFAQQAVSVRVAKFRSSDEPTMEAIEAEAEAADAGESFVQLKSVRQLLRGSKLPAKDGRLVVQELLRSKGHELKSTLLAALASKISENDPFAKIKTLINELIERLLQEAANEANQKGWCDKAMADATQKRDYAAEEIKELNAQMAKLEALRDGLTEDLSELKADILELNTSRAEAIQNRKDEQAENNATIIEAEEGLKALDMCITLLDHFYKTVKKETVDLSLAQQSPEEDAPDAGFDNGEAYTGAQSESGGIMGMLEVMKSDFVRTIKETSEAEEEAQQDHLEFMTETGKSLAKKTQASIEKTQQKDDAEEKLANADDDMTAQTSILKTSLEELLELKPACIDTGMTYEERVARREDEIAALKKADCILQNYAEYGPDGLSEGC